MNMACLYTLLYASGFRILGAKGLESTILEVTDPWQGADSVVRRLFISRNGEQAPHDGIMSAITFPARRVVCMSSSHVALLDASGAYSPMYMYGIPSSLSLFSIGLAPLTP